MSLWSKVFQKRDLPSKQLLEEAKIFLQQMEHLSRQDPKAAMKRLEKTNKQFHEFLQLGGFLHEPFRNIVLSVRPAALPSVSLHSWGAWEAPKLKDVIETAEAAKEEVLYIASTRQSIDPFRQLDALYEFSKDSNLVMQVIGEETMLFRRSFVLSAAATLNRDSEDIGQDLIDFAKRHGMHVRTHM